MFEQSMVEARAITARPWTLGVSVLGQAVLVTAAVVLPMLHPEVMQRVVKLVPVGGPPRAYHPAAPQKVEPGRPMSTNSRSAPRFTFTAPVRIPDRIAILQDPPPQFSGPVGSSAGFGVPGGIDAVGEGGPGLGVLPPPVPTPVRQAPQQVVRQAPAPAAPTEPVRRGGDVQASLLIYKPEPSYPPLARQARVSGIVHLTALISTEGRISSLRAMDGHPLLIKAAIDAVKQWVYRPTLLNGVPVEVVTEITVTFTLN